jgi:hypothetical protein
MLMLDRHSCVLTSLLVVRSATGHPLLALDVAVPVPPQGIEDTFQLR